MPGTEAKVEENAVLLSGVWVLHFLVLQGARDFSTVFQVIEKRLEGFLQSPVHSSAQGISSRTTLTVLAVLPWAKT